MGGITPLEERANAEPQNPTVRTTPGLQYIHVVAVPFLQGQRYHIHCGLRKASKDCRPRWKRTMAIYAHEIGNGDPVLTRIVDDDNVPWYKKRNLRTLYLLLFPACMGIEMTSGFDSQLINTLQFAPPFLQCKSVLGDNFGLSLTSFRLWQWV
jgi:hypothetical protein